MADVGRILAIREQARARGDHGLVREADAALAAAGYRPETTEAAELPERAVPPKPVRRTRRD